MVKSGLPSFSEVPREKANLRESYKLLRDKLAKNPKEMPLSKVLPLLKEEGLVVSFCDIKGEVGTSVINIALANAEKLVLPRINGNELELYSVHDPALLTKSKLGILEPSPALFHRVDDLKIRYILVPGLAFDNDGHRLGYGKGYYDRLLSRMPNAITFGLGYSEQLSPTPLPTEPHDISLHGLCLI